MPYARPPVGAKKFDQDVSEAARKLLVGLKAIVGSGSLLDEPLVTACISHLFHSSCHLHLGLNLVLPLLDLRIPLLILLKVVFCPGNDLLYCRILFQEVELRDSSLNGLMVLLVQLRFFFLRGCIRGRSRGICVRRSSIYGREKRLGRTKRRSESKKLFPDLGAYNH